MTTEERIDRLEGAVERIATETATFIKGQTEVHATISRAVLTLTKAQATLTANVATLVEDVRSQSATIHRLDEMISRFDAWLRGQGPKDGHER